MQPNGVVNGAIAVFLLFMFLLLLLMMLLFLLHMFFVDLDDAPIVFVGTIVVNATSVVDAAVASISEALLLLLLVVVAVL